MIKLPPQLQNQYRELENARQTSIRIAADINRLEIQKVSVENAITELEKALEKEQNPIIYKNAGVILIRAPDAKKILEELKEKNELLEMRLKSRRKQLERVNEQIQTMSNRLTQALQQLRQSQDFQTPM